MIFCSKRSFLFFAVSLEVDTVRNFFGGSNFKEGKSVGFHTEPGPDGGLVMLDDTTVLDLALKILKVHNINHWEEVSEELMQA